MTNPNKIPREIKDYIRELCLKHKTWGPKKIISILKREGHEWKIPSADTISLIRKNAGLVQPLKRRYKSILSKPAIGKECTKNIWTIDYNGEFQTGDGNYCYPLTITDYKSR